MNYQSKENHFQLLNYCNSTYCQVVNFDLSDFPSHVEDDVLHAFRPIIIQVSLPCDRGNVHRILHTPEYTGGIFFRMHYIEQELFFS